MGVTSTIKAWSQFTRAHTAVLEAPLPVVAYVLATGNLFTVDVLPWLGLGMLYHYVGYGMNSWTDWRNGYDKDDPEKQHHPLNTGEITGEQAKTFTIAGLLAVFVYSLVLGRLSLVSVGFVVTILFTGSLYNLFGKSITIKALPISISHTAVFVFPYLQLSSSLDFGFLFLATAYFLHHYFQIGISGDVKDVCEDEANLITALGGKVEYTKFNEPLFRPGETVQVVSYVLCTAQISLTIIALMFIGESVAAFILVSALSMLMAYEVDKVIQPGAYHRESRVVHMSRKELFGYLMMNSAVYPVVGLEGVAIIFISMLGYLLAVSKFTWGNWIKPEV